MEDIKITASNGRGKYGAQYVFIHPGNGCVNRSRRVLRDKVDATILKYYTPLNFYTVDGYKIGANTPENALAEYRRICGIANLKKQFTPRLCA